MHALRSAGPARLTLGEEQQLRELADTLLFAVEFDDEVRRALASARAVLVALPVDVQDAWVDDLASNLEDCGPRSRILARPGPLRVQPSWGARRGGVWGR